MKRILTITLAVAALSLLTSPVFSVSSDLESSLLEKALIEGAVTKEQKSAVSNYLASVASEKKKLADSYREMAQVNYGGKALTQDLRVKRLLNLANALDKLAASYENLANNYSPAEYQKLAKLEE
jgi:acyl carrier protein phosphodiesterase